VPRPCIRRRVDFRPGNTFFKPQGVPLRLLGSVRLGPDELEAIRLADWLGLYHAEAAEKMEVSRQTFGNILKSARAKVAEALVRGLAIRLEAEATPEENQT